MPKVNPPSSDPIIATLRAERCRRGLSQTDLGQLIGRETYQTIWQWENGANNLSLPNLREWANALGYDVALVPMEQPSITCPRCGRTSFNPNDISERYCGNCHQYHDQMV